MKVSVKDFQQWQHSGVEESFVFWSLNNRVINKKSYFEWAVEHYQIPFLEDAFFEQYLITKKQWEKIKDLTKWTPEMMPVAVWEDTIFVGCVELPLGEEQKFEFKHRFVLTSSMALQTTWKFVNELSRFIREDQEATQSKLTEQIKSNNENSHQKIKLQTKSDTQKTDHSPEKATLKEKNKVLHETNLAPDIPPEKKHPLDNPSIHQPSTQLSAEENSVSGVQTESTELKINSESDTQKTDHSPEKATLKEKNKVLHETNLAPDIPPEKKHPLDNPSIHQPSTQLSAEENSVSGVQTESTELKINSEVLKMDESFPVVEEERAADVDNSTSPGRSPHGEENNLIMGDFRSKTSHKKKTSSEKEGIASRKEETSLTEELTISDSSDEEYSETEVTIVSTTGVSQFRVSRDEHYERLWKQTRSVFCTSMVLKVRDDKVYHYVWSGLMKVKEKDKGLANFKDHSLFKIVQKGHAYHGFVVDTPANKKFFNEIGWKQYPKHVTAIPVKNKKQELVKIFAGLSMTPLSRDKIQSVEKIVFDFFRSHHQQTSQAA